nr:TasA family protein [Tissierella sp.]
MKKRRIMLVSSLILVILLVAGGTMAWFTATADPVVNEFKAGTVIIRVGECFNACDAANVNPGDCIQKHVKFYNDGTKRMFVRVELDAKFIDETLEMDGVVSYDIGADWVLHTDGYYYYTKEVAPLTGKTSEIISEVCFDGPAMDNTYQGAKFTLTVKSEAIQVTNGAALAEWGVNPLSLAP